ncbi:MAG TPA: hypothetical protein DEB10_14645 [Ruminococcaceae bacterium]|nr:hypothetical protein [Oscillospiraceae bacterium]
MFYISLVQHRKCVNIGEKATKLFAGADSISARIIEYSRTDIERRDKPQRYWKTTGHFPQGKCPDKLFSDYQRCKSSAKICAAHLFIIKKLG